MDADSPDNTPWIVGDLGTRLGVSEAAKKSKAESTATAGIAPANSGSLMRKTLIPPGAGASFSSNYHSKQVDDCRFPALTSMRKTRCFLPSAAPSRAGLSAMRTADCPVVRRVAWMAGAPGFEPGNVGTKNRCLTAWRRPIKAPPYSQFTGAPQPCQATIGRSMFENRQRAGALGHPPGPLKALARRLCRRYNAATLAECGAAW
jgi:hypothetical protein